MSSSAKHICTICHCDEVSKTAVTWCTECEVFFCGDCEKPHKKLRLTINHKTISSQDYPTFIQEISSQCRDHNKNFERYCSVHACPCCDQCITDEHQKCGDMQLLSDAIKQVKESFSVELYKNELVDVNENLNKAIKYLTARINAVNTQKTEAFDEILYTRKSIDDYFNKIEQKVLDDLESKHLELKLNMASIVQQMEQRLHKIEKIQSEFTKMIQCATELELYFGLREIEKTTSEAAKYISDLKESSDHFSEKNLEVKISSDLLSSIQDVKSFGDININTTSSTLLVKTGRKNQALCIPRSDQIKPSLLKKLTIPKDMKFLNILACLILSDGKVIILDYNKKQLLLFSDDGFFIKKVVTFREYPLDACVVIDNTVAVLLGSANKTALVDVEENKIIQKVELFHYCYGVASDGRNLIISSDDNKIIKVNLDDMSQTIFKKGVEELYYIALFQGIITGTTSFQNEICCCKSTGEPLWTFQPQDIAEPGGLTIDKHGYVHIASCRNNSIVVLSPDGKTCKTILSEDDGIKSPWGIDINKEKGLMVVSSFMRDNRRDPFYDTAFIYKI
ncbi:Hypothetical predicted protein [Mytilus galloprovincialis]|uniref:B box-type domain-containing protein n=1 Tax=Mytilus galloprovincialis TaxID=29158 RepID=A0A8B6GBG8_MYTGA|nr:Hypothetical predicted protein [Mytilus galloprovincialis]